MIYGHSQNLDEIIPIKHYQNTLFWSPFGLDVLQTGKQHHLHITYFSLSTEFLIILKLISQLVMI